MEQRPPPGHLVVKADASGRLQKPPPGKVVTTGVGSAYASRRESTVELALALLEADAVGRGHGGRRIHARRGRRVRSLTAASLTRFPRRVCSSSWWSDAVGRCRHGWVGLLARSTAESPGGCGGATRTLDADAASPSQKLLRHDWTCPGLRDTWSLVLSLIVVVRASVLNYRAERVVVVRSWLGRACSGWSAGAGGCRTPRCIRTPRIAARAVTARCDG
jgi:hypothetical protein